MWSVLGEGAKFSLVAQSMVFLVLFLLALVILLLKLIFYRPGRAVDDREPAAAESASQEPGEALEVAAVAAALEMHRQGGAPQPPPIVGQDVSWAPRQPHSRPETLQSKSRRWSRG
jgi:Na+-transporting methylmalonyl-CoA/oxaloacetate decarboxylase gamma subunit